MAGQRFTPRLRRFTSLVVGFLALFVLTLALAPRAEAYVYWADLGADTIGRANLDGTGVDQSLIAGLESPGDVAVDGAHVYWTYGGIPAIGRANLDGTGIDPSFITEDSDVDLRGVAVDAARIYWVGNFSESVCQSEECPEYDFIRRRNLDGSSAGAQLEFYEADF